MDPKGYHDKKHLNGYGLVFEKSAVRQGREQVPDEEQDLRRRSRSRSPRRHDGYTGRTAPRSDRDRGGQGRDYRQHDYNGHGRR